MGGRNASALRVLSYVGLPFKGTLPLLPLAFHCQVESVSLEPESSHLQGIGGVPAVPSSTCCTSTVSYEIFELIYMHRMLFNSLYLMSLLFLPSHVL